MAHEVSKENFICSATHYQPSAICSGLTPFAISSCFLLSAIRLCYLLFTPLHTGSKSDLPPRFVDDHTHCVGEIEAPVSRDHGYADTLLF